MVRMFLFRVAGLSVFCCCIGVHNIIAADSDAKRLNMAKRLGAAYTVNFMTENALENVKSITGKGADMAFQCTGSPKAESAIWYYVRRGGSMCELGFFVNNGDMTYRGLKIVVLGE